MQGIPLWQRASSPMLRGPPLLHSRRASAAPQPSSAGGRAATRRAPPRAAQGAAARRAGRRRAPRAPAARDEHALALTLSWRCAAARAARARGLPGRRRGAGVPFGLQQVHPQLLPDPGPLHAGQGAGAAGRRCRQCFSGVQRWSCCSGGGGRRRRPLQQGRQQPSGPRAGPAPPPGAPCTLPHPLPAARAVPPQAEGASLCWW